MRILLAEDDALLADGLARALRQSGHQVDIAADGLAADQCLAGQGYELAILDLGLPGIDGSTVLQRLRERRQQTPVLVLSARMAIEERVRLLDLGADDYVVKPFNPAEVAAGPGPCCAAPWAAGRGMGEPASCAPVPWKSTWTPSASASAATGANKPWP